MVVFLLQSILFLFYLGRPNSNRERTGTSKVPGPDTLPPQIPSASNHERETVFRPNAGDARTQDPSRIDQSEFTSNNDPDSLPVIGSLENGRDKEGHIQNIVITVSVLIIAAICLIIVTFILRRRKRKTTTDTGI